MLGFRSLKEKTLSFAILSSLVAFAGAPYGFASGNGAGYNGPSLNSRSIPLQLDRGISFENARNAVVTCLLSGDDKTGLTSVADRLVSAFSQCPSCRFTPGSELFLRIPVVDSERKVISLEGYKKEIEPYYTRPATLKITSLGEVELKEYAFRLDSGEVVKLKVSLPQVAFGSVMEDSGYDDLGRLIEAKKILRDVKILLPANYGPAVPLVNTTTGKNTFAKVNLEEYVECLQSQIQRHAE